LKKKLRIKKNKDFQIVFKQGKSFANRQFIIYVLEKPEQPHFRVGLSVSKKIGNSVTRNRIKRCIRQAILELKDQIKQERDYVIIARNPASEMGFHEIKNSLVHVMKLAKAFNKQDKGSF
jgi:ribonuclease P protein component